MKDTWNANPELIKILEEAVAESKEPDKSIVGTGKQSYSIRRILEEVRSGTSFGKRYQESWERLQEG